MPLNPVAPDSFSVSPLPRIIFGNGALLQAAEIAATFGGRVLLVTGGRSFLESDSYARLAADFSRFGLSWDECRVQGEPSPQLVDDLVNQFRGSSVEVVVGIGGGSVLDAAKAIAGLLATGNSVMDFLEGVGPELPYQGPSVPYISIPTTAGTGSEATKNAVLSVQGVDGFKKSFRHDLLVPRYAIVDPMLLSSCPPALIAANGMDALTQLLESFSSIRANPFSDALARSGLIAVREGLLRWHAGGAGAGEASQQMAYAALLSGITLAQVGLGSVHGLASPLGAFFPIPHGVVCGTLVAAATRTNIEALLSRQPGSVALEKYAEAGRLFALDDHLSRDQALQALVDILEAWTQQLGLPQLSEYGISEADLDRIVANCRGSSMKTNPVELTDTELRALLAERL